MPNRWRPDFTKEEKEKVLQFLLQHSKDGVLQRGTPKEAAAVLGVSVRSVRQIWTTASQQLKNGEVVHFQNRRKGVQHFDKMKPNEDNIRALPVKDRGTIRRMASKLGISKSLVGEWIKDKQLGAHTSAVKPLLTEENKLARLKFSLSQLNSAANIDGKFTFKGMHNVVHIDEKWFYMSNVAERYYLLPHEEDPYRTCKSKRFIQKIMFLCAVTRPIFNETGEMIFDGKIGIFPFTEVVPAQRNSKNRVRGTMETKPIQSITKSIIKDCIINKVIPAIKEKWPEGASKVTLIQQDNAKPHLKSDDLELIEAGNSDGFNISLMSQPPNSPDTNINDLGFFRAIQSLKDEKSAYNVDQLVEHVKNAFEELSAYTINNVFLTLQCCLGEIMKEKGGNNYKILHINKAKLQRNGLLPDNIQVEESIIKECLDYLMQKELEAGSSYDLRPLKSTFGYES
ncbi:uncharacterized protein LOC131018588 [Salvia miltiorrhiza]|uniref:uncharacterized protein LOC131018588 n=1 Tax=Salvia miltiorrhiza TaxID=226208 RepID=UPI0025AC1123|nr:uncharacterized protein LOC131018588 [Salvia miltiorrhiza]